MPLITMFEGLSYFSSTKELRLHLKTNLNGKPRSWTAIMREQTFWSLLNRTTSLRFHAEDIALFKSVFEQPSPSWTYVSLRSLQRGPLLLELQNHDELFLNQINGVNHRFLEDLFTP
jgi:hypothetical protein